MSEDLEFFKKLKEKREELDLSIEEISDSIKIDKKYLRALEQGNFDVLPNTYMRLFLKTYAEELNLDVDEILNKYDEFIGEQESTEKEINSQKEDNEKESKLNIKPSEQKKNISTVIITILILIFAIFMLKKIFNSENQDTSEANTLDSTEIPIDDTTNSREDIPNEKEKEKQDTIVTEGALDEEEQGLADTSTIEAETLSLEANFQDTCWMRIIVDETDTSEAIYYNNNRGSWEGEEKFKVEIGNPEALSRLSLNGRNLGSVGKNVPVILLINRNGIYKRTTLE